MTQDLVIAYAQDGLAALIIILLGMIKIPKIEINLWSLLAKKIGKALNSEVLESVEQLRKDFEQHLKAEEEDKAKTSRQRILEHEGQLRRKFKFTREAWSELLSEIDYYNQYCKDHEDYENAKATIAIDYILESYADAVKNNDFLV